MNNENNTQLLNLLTIIDGWKLNKVFLASKINMKHSTFKNKINAKYPQYKLTESEQEKLIEVLKEMATDIENNFGISFNKALAKISRKKV
jgi:hypothetical protein